MGTFRLVNECLPSMVARGGGHVVATGSIAGMEPYEGGSVYCASKHALHAFMKALRYETHAKNVRCTVVAPGLVGEGTEFSAGRFHGDEGKAAATYLNIDELKATDVAAQVAARMRHTTLPTARCPRHAPSAPDCPLPAPWPIMMRHTFPLPTARAAHPGWPSCSWQILWAVRQPGHVNLDLIQVMPTSQGGATRVHRA